MKPLLPHSDEDVGRFGRIILEWGHLESVLLNILLRLTHPRFNLDFPKFPIELKRRIELAKHGYQRIPAMSHLTKEALVLLNALGPLSKQRHIIVHGYYQGFTGGNTYMFGFYRRSKEEGRFEFHHFTHEEITELTDKVVSASEQLQELSRKTFLVPFPEHEPSRLLLGNPHV